MGADYYECNKCGCSFNADSDYRIYCDCGARFCSKECAKAKYEEGVDYDDKECGTCCICRIEYCGEHALLMFLLKHFNISIDEAKKLYFEQAKND